jgi:hypothetical protein
MKEKMSTILMDPFFYSISFHLVFRCGKRRRMNRPLALGENKTTSTADSGIRALHRDRS